MQPDPPAGGLLARVLNDPRAVAGIDGCAHGRGEDIPVVRPLLRELHTLLGLPLAVPPERLHHHGLIVYEHDPYHAHR